MARRPSLSLEERSRNCRKSALLDDHQFLKKLNPSQLRVEVVDDLLDRFPDNYQITRDEVQATIEMLGYPWVLIKAIKRGFPLFEVSGIAQKMSEGIDIIEKFPRDREVVEKYIADLLNGGGDLEQVSELMKSIAPNHDFSEVIRNSEREASRLGIGNLAARIRRTFSHIVFDSSN